ncbi:MAG: hypothetical protein K9I71_00435 [Ignavibacteriales bacterium]|nr:hypothetical protein [Ignavibacteriales bacterium]MCF8314555.1 hypothetical protein [Ignavibacteriales bacterium]MCF8436408.1 hypothetical protein [Ignavibacteriales bacterium]
MKTAIIVFLIATFLTGCYTLTEHPAVKYKDDSGRLDRFGVILSDDCMSCHTGSEFDSFYSFQNQQIDEKKPDQNYYDSDPWWLSFSPLITSEENTYYPDSLSGERIYYSRPERNYIPAYPVSDMIIPSPTVSRPVNVSQESGDKQRDDNQTTTTRESSSPERQNRNNNSGRSGNSGRK